MSCAASLTISIVSYNTCPDLLACLASIFDNPPQRAFEVVVVDNGSTDGSVERVRAAFPQVRLIETGENLGYGRANNRALLGAAGDAYAILNSDLVLRPGSLDRCVDYLGAHPEAGIVGGALLDPDGKPQRDWAAGELDLAAVVSEQLFLGRLLPLSQLFGDYFKSGWRRCDTRALPQVCGAFLVARADLYNRIGGFDEDYWMYCEDTDLCKRIRNDGLACVYVHDAPAVHGHGKSSAGALRPRMVLAHNESRVVYLRKHGAPGDSDRAKRIMLAGSALRLALWSVAGMVVGRGDWRDKGRGYVDVLRGTGRIGQMPPR